MFGFYLPSLHFSDQATKAPPAEFVEVSDSSPARQRQVAILSPQESTLVAACLQMPQVTPSDPHDLLPHLDKAFFSQFKTTLQAASNMYSVILFTHLPKKIHRQTVILYVFFSQ